MQAEAARHPEAERVELWFINEAGIGQKDRVTHLWCRMGTWPRRMWQQGSASVCMFGAVCPERDTGAALALPEISTVAMNLS